MRHDMLPMTLPDSTWNSCNWQSKVSKVGFKPRVMYHFPLKSAMLKFLTSADGSGTLNSPTSDFLGTHFLRDTAHSLNSSTTLFSNKSPHLICNIRRYVQCVDRRDWCTNLKCKKYLAFCLIRTIVAGLQASNVCSTGRIRNALGQLHPDQEIKQEKLCKKTLQFSFSSGENEVTDKYLQVTSARYDNFKCLL